MTLLAHDNMFLDPVGGTVTYTDTGATFSASPPIENMSKMQVPRFAQFTETADFDVTTGSPVTVKVLGLMSHTLTDGMVVEFFNGATSLGSVTVANYRGVTQNAILVLGSEETFTTLTVEITGGAPGTQYRIGALWASPAFEASVESSDFGFDTTSLSVQNYASATGYTARRDSYDAPTLSYTALSRAKAIGPEYPNLKSIISESGMHAPVLAIPIETELAYSTYGLIEDATGPGVRSGDLWRATLTIREQK